MFRSDKKDDKEKDASAVAVPLLLLRDIVVFPHMVVPLFVGRQRSICFLTRERMRRSTSRISVSARIWPRIFSNRSVALSVSSRFWRS